MAPCKREAEERDRPDRRGRRKRRPDNGRGDCAPDEGTAGKQRDDEDRADVRNRATWMMPAKQR